MVEKNAYGNLHHALSDIEFTVFYQKDVEPDARKGWQAPKGAAL